MSGIINTLARRSLIENCIRRFLLDKNFIEVRTPIVCKFPDITPVSQYTVTVPFDNDEFYLRIAPTEYLKRLMQMNMTSVFEFSTNFRNDRYDDTHLPEFTSLEIMEKNRSVYDMMDLIESLCKVVYNTAKCDGAEISLSSSFLKPWPRIKLPEYFCEHYHVTAAEICTYDGVQRIYEKVCGKTSNENYGELLDEIIITISKEYETPVFIGEFPWHLGGPAKESNLYSGYKERYELFYNGLELANMSSTLTDIEQVKAWYNETIKLKKHITNKSYSLDADLMSAFECGMPPCAVVGIGIDRLIQLLLGVSSIRDVVCFCELK